MQVGIGLPNAIPETPAEGLTRWAIDAERCGFSSLATIGRVAYPTFEELTVLAAAAAVTDRIGLLTNVLLGPTRNTTQLAKQALTVGALSGGRLTLGLGVGSRPDDYRLSEREFRARGTRFDDQLAELGRILSDGFSGGDRPVVGPRLKQGQGIPLLIGGMSSAAVRRVVTHADGWTAPGTATAEAIEERIPLLREAWQGAGRQGTPRIVALAYYALGADAQASREFLFDYYGKTERAHNIADAMLHGPDAIRRALESYRLAGVDELVLGATSPDPRQVEELADIVA